MFAELEIPKAVEAGGDREAEADQRPENAEKAVAPEVAGGTGERAGAGMGNANAQEKQQPRRKDDQGAEDDAADTDGFDDASPLASRGPQDHLRDSGTVGRPDEEDEEADYGEDYGPDQARDQAGDNGKAQPAGMDLVERGASQRGAIRAAHASGTRDHAPGTDRAAALAARDRCLDLGMAVTLHSLIIQYVR